MAANFKTLFYDLKTKAENERRRLEQEKNSSAGVRRFVSEFSYRRYVEVRPRVSRLRCLEIGLGGGWAMHDMLAQGAQHVDGIDVSDQQVEQTEASLTQLGFKNFKVWCDDAERLEKCAANTYDYVNFSDVIEHVVSADAAVRAIQRVLKPGGMVYIKTPNDYTDAELKQHHYVNLMLLLLVGRSEGELVENELFLRDDVKHLSAEEKAELEAAVPEGFHEHNHQFRPDELAEFVQERGFEIVTLTGMPLFSDMMYQFENDLNAMAEQYVKFAGSPAYLRFVEAMQKDLIRSEHHPEYDGLPADYVFSDHLIVVARKI